MQSGSQDISGKQAVLPSCLHHASSCLKCHCSAAVGAGTWLCADATFVAKSVVCLHLRGPGATSTLWGLTLCACDAGELEMRVFDTPGHTRGHVTYWFPEAKALFPGAFVRD